jgi:predicted transcriptional regulator of viral defense system
MELKYRNDALRYAREQGLFSLADAKWIGISAGALNNLAKSGIIVKVIPGIYMHADCTLENPELAAISLRYPKAVICLTSALNFHHLTEAIPEHIDIAIPTSSSPPRSLLIHSHRFNPQAYSTDIELCFTGKFPIRIYSPAKTIADCFRFRSEIGIATFLDALSRYLRSDSGHVGELMGIARLLHIDKGIRPYIETLLG